MAEAKETAQYSFPEEALLEMEPDASLLKTIEYKCTSTGVSVKDASAMLSYVKGQRHQKSLEKKNLAENDSIIGLLERYAELEKPHREAMKIHREESNKEYMQKIKDLKESMSKEEYKKHQKEKRDEKKKARSDAAEDDEEPKGKRSRTAIWNMVWAQDKTPYRCGATKKTLRGYQEVKEHMQSEEFKEAACKYNENGCALCGFYSDDKEKVLEHFLSISHFKRLHHLAYYGMDVSNWYVGP